MNTNKPLRTRQKVKARKAANRAARMATRQASPAPDAPIVVQMVDESALTPAQLAAFRIIRLGDGAGAGTRNDEDARKVNVRAARSLVAKGLVTEDDGPNGVMFRAA